MLLALGTVLCACTGSTFAGRPPSVPRIERLINVALSWRPPENRTAPAGLRLLRDGAPFAHPNLAIAHSILRSNPRVGVFDALYLADVAIAAARSEDLDADFFGATLLQESAFDPNAISSAGAVGIAQFTIATADAYGVDPFDVETAIRGAAALLAEYVRRYRGRYEDPYAVALAAYNAGPDAVAKYGGVPPYAETRTYIADVYERWARIVGDERVTRTPV
jgi:soluble lytic murein transglycosylase-like protein